MATKDNAGTRGRLRRLALAVPLAGLALVGCGAVYDCKSGFGFGVADNTAAQDMTCGKVDLTTAALMNVLGYGRKVLSDESFVVTFVDTLTEIAAECDGPAYGCHVVRQVRGGPDHTAAFVLRRGSPCLADTSLAHELLHHISYERTGDADGNHNGLGMWGTDGAEGVAKATARRAEACQ